MSSFYSRQSYGKKKDGLPSLRGKPSDAIVKLRRLQFAGEVRKQNNSRMFVIFLDQILSSKF